MRVSSAEIIIDSFTKFHNSIYVSGWFFDANDALVDVQIIGKDLIIGYRAVGLPHGGVLGLGPNLGFSCQCISTSDILIGGIYIIFKTSSGLEYSIKANDLCEDRLSRYNTYKLSDKFIGLVNGAGAGAMLLDIGGRDRSAIDRRGLFSNSDVTVFDIVPGANVDVVGDAHRLSEYFPENKFDFALSVSVFEHLLMPWKVAFEMAKVLKIGGIGFVHTHQTIGIHDAPWDFYRFSSYCWPGLFNAHTGFEIIESQMDTENYILPFIPREGNMDYEKSAGCESSAVMIRKVGDPKVEWNVGIDDILNSQYPTS